MLTFIFAVLLRRRVNGISKKNSNGQTQSLRKNSKSVQVFKILVSFHKGNSVTRVYSLTWNDLPERILFTAAPLKSLSLLKHSLFHSTPARKERALQSAVKRLYYNSIYSYPGHVGEPAIPVGPVVQNPRSSFIHPRVSLHPTKVTKIVTRTYYIIWYIK